MKENEIPEQKLADLRKLAALYIECYTKYGVRGIDTNSIHLVDVVDTGGGDSFILARCPLTNLTL